VERSPRRDRDRPSAARLRLDQHRRVRQHGPLFAGPNKKPPEGGFLDRPERPVYFFIASAAAEAEALAAMADESAADAAMVAAPIALDASAAGGVTTTVDGAGAGVVTVSSFLLHAANEMAATNETNSSAFFILVPQKSKRGSNNYRQLWEPSLRRAPAFEDKGKLEHSTV
jgi:hypothetical protein